MSVLLISSLYMMVAFKKQAINLTLQNAQALIDKGILQNKILQLNEDKKLVESEEFMQFMISSRDHAFAYIESVQESLNEYKKVMDPIISYHTTYGGVLGKTFDWERLEEISKAYNELLNVLPKENS